MRKVFNLNRQNDKDLTIKTRDYHIKAVEVDTISNEVSYVFKLTEDPDYNITLELEIKAHIARVFPFLSNINLSGNNETRELRLTINDPFTIAETCWILQNYPSYSTIIKPDCINEITRIAETIKGQFAKGGNTAFHETKKNQIGRVAEYKGHLYLTCDGTIDFTRGIFNIRSFGTDREIILLDRSDTTMKTHYEEFLSELQVKYPYASLENVFNFACAFSNKKITSTKFNIEKAKEDIRIDGVTHQAVIYPLQEIIADKKGVCRHHALFTAFLLGEYFKKHAHNISIHHCRDTWKHPQTKQKIAHSWVVCKQKDRLYLIDPMWQCQFNLTDPSDYQAACSHFLNKGIYTKEVIDNTLKRANLTPPDPNKILAELLNNHQADAEQIKKLIRAGADVNTQGSSYGNWTAAHIAAYNNNLDLMHFLDRRKETNFNVLSLRRSRPLIFFAKSSEMVNFLLNKSNDVNLLLVEDTQGKKAIDELKNLKDPKKLLTDILALQLEKHPEANIEVIQTLIEAGAEVNTQGGNLKDGLTAAHIAADKNNLTLINFLASHNADFNIKGSFAQKTPLFYATSKEMATLLMAKNADPKILDREKKRAPIVESIEKEEKPIVDSPAVVEIQNNNYSFFNHEKSSLPSPIAIALPQEDAQREVFEKKKTETISLKTRNLEKKSPDILNVCNPLIDAPIQPHSIAPTEIVIESNIFFYVIDKIMEILSKLISAIVGFFDKPSEHQTALSL